MAADVPKEIQRFISDYIQTLEQLEVLLLVAALPDRAWTVDGVFQVVQTNREVVQARLDEFVGRGLMHVAAGEYRYAPQTPELARQVAATSEFYKLRRHTMVEFIYSRPDDELRNFSDAFRFRKE